MTQTQEEIMALAKKYYRETHAELPLNNVPVSGKVYNEKELQNLIACALEGWWTEGKWNALFEKKIKEFLNVNHALTLNSGSSANLIALKTLASVKLKQRRIMKGDEIITTACCFPTTVNAILEIGAVPVFVDVDESTYNADINGIEKAINSKTKAIFLAHTLGNPFHLDKITKICKDNNLWLIEDNCDALGSKYDGRYTGTFGDLATLSFYPAHHITTAEGGAILANDQLLYKIARSLRDWGRDCWCPTGRNNTCKKRFSWQLGDLPYGYDHKYIYSERGYNLKMTDLQAAIGVAQMDKLPGFIRTRTDNFSYLHDKMKDFSQYLMLPKATENSHPAWFGFPVTIKDSTIKRNDLIAHLSRNHIDTRLLFAGNVTKQPYFKDYHIQFKQIGKLKNSDSIMKNTFWLGVYPALKKEHLDYVHNKLSEFVKTKTPKTMD